MPMTLHRIFTGISPDNSSITWYSCCCSELPNHLPSPHNLFLIEHQLCGLWLVPESVRPSTLIYILQGYKVPVQSFVELNFSFEKQRPSLRSITGSRIWTNGYCRQETSTFECFNQMNLLDKVSIFISTNKLVEWFKNAVDFFIIFTNEANIKANTLDVAVYNVPKLTCISCRLNYGIILILIICKPKSSCWFDDINNLLLVCFKKSWWRCISFQQCKRSVDSKMPRYWGNAMRNSPWSLFT